MENRFTFLKKCANTPDAQKSKKVKQLSKTAQMCKSKEKRLMHEK